MWNGEPFVDKHAENQQGPQPKHIAHEGRVNPEAQVERGRQGTEPPSVQIQRDSREKAPRSLARSTVSRAADRISGTRLSICRRIFTKFLHERQFWRTARAAASEPPPKDSTSVEAVSNAVQCDGCRETIVSADGPRHVLQRLQEGLKGSSFFRGRPVRSMCLNGRIQRQQLCAESRRANAVSGDGPPVAAFVWTPPHRG